MFGLFACYVLFVLLFLGNVYLIVAWLCCANSVVYRLFFCLMLVFCLFWLIVFLCVFCWLFDIVWLRLGGLGFVNLWFAVWC